MNKIPMLLGALLLAGCASKDAGQQVGQAATTPLRDLNVVKAEIPEPLQRAKAAPRTQPLRKGRRIRPAETAAATSSE